MAPEGSIKPKAGSVVDQIVEMREQWHIKNHPFFQLMSKGELELKPLGVWLSQHYQWVTYALKGFGVLFSRAPDDVRMLVLENLAEEAGLMAGPGEGRVAHDHMELIYRFCNHVGISTEDVQNTRPTPPWLAQAFHYHYCVCEEPVGVAMAMASTQEGQQPALNHEVTIPAFLKHYGFTMDSPEIEFFTEHAVADEDHSRRQLELTHKYCNTPEIKARALEVSYRACTIRWETVSDVYRREVLKDANAVLLPKGISL